MALGRIEKDRKKWKKKIIFIGKTMIFDDFSPLFGSFPYQEQGWYWH